MKKVLKKVMKDAEKAKIETTQEGRSFLKGRYQYWIKK